MKKVLLVVILCKIYVVLSDAATDFNHVNPDGSFSFGLSTNDNGGHYHSATGNANQVVRGRYGSRNPSTGRIDETIYTAGPRGFRARGPNIHRKMDLSQIPRGPIGSPDDPLADPYDDPSYGFGFKTPGYSRREDADSTGRVRGLYSFLDDVGERHLVRYAAGKETGYQVFNTYPDSPVKVRYSAPLYKTANKKARGRVAIERGPGGQYKFVSSGPDQRRSETSGPDGIVRGSYSYLDDKGIQRTVQYIAGPGIGYRVVKTLTGPGSHNLPRPALPEFGIRSQDSNDVPGDGPQFDDPHDDGLFATAASGPIKPPNRNNFNKNGNKNLGGTGDNRGTSASDWNGNSGDYDNRGTKTNTKDYKDYGNSYDDNDGKDDSDLFSKGFDVNPEDEFSFNQKKTPPSTGSSSPRERNNQRPPPTSSNQRPASRPQDSSGGQFNVGGQNFEEDYSDFPTVSYNRNDLEKSRDRDWSQKGRDSTLIKNVGKEYVGLPPGAIVRAHVQSIDILPLNSRSPTPGEALRRDEEAKL